MNIKHYQNLPSESYKYIYNRVPRLCVDVVIRNVGDVLLSRRSIPPHIGRWYLPGGRVYKHELLEDAAKRICLRELGVRAKAVKVLGVIEYVREPRAPRFITHSVSVVFLVRPTAGTFRGSRQAREVSFFKSLPKNTAPEVREFLRGHHFIKR